jgi:monovalent cation/hydrogen antiporter
VHGFEIVLGLVVLAAVVAALAEWLRAPAPSLLVIAGFLVGLLPNVPDVSLDPHLVSFAILPPLLWAAATEVALSELRPVLGTVGVLAVGLVAASAAAVALVTHAIFDQVSLAEGFVLGAVLASTDPIAVGALARRLQLPPRLLALVQGESLLNDATSLVLFRVAVGVAAAGAGVSILHATWDYVRLGVGGAVIGVAAAVFVRFLRRRMQDPVLETVTALIVPYAIYVLAEISSTSGVTAVVFAGLFLGARERSLGLSRGATRLRIATVYAVVQFLLESVVFAVIGLELPVLVRRLAGSDQQFALGALAITATVIVVRALWMYPSTYLPYWLGRLRGHSAASTRPPWQVPTVITWVGTRGVVPLTAALSIPLTVDSGGPFPHRDLLLVLTISCILITLVVQGLTLAPLVNRLGVIEDPARRTRDELVARDVAAQAALARLDELLDVQAVPQIVAIRLRGELEQRALRDQQRLAAYEASAETSDATAWRRSDDEAYRALRRDLLAAESSELRRLRDIGQISEATRRTVQRSLDIQETALDEGRIPP